MSARKERHGSGILSDGITEIVRAKTRQQIPVCGGSRAMLAEIATL